ncbi:hypothetical protein JOM56_009700 [Amanita muscaria]
MPTKPVVQASTVSSGCFSGLTVDPLEENTTPSSPALSVFSSVKPEKSFETPLSYTHRCLTDVFNKKAPDFNRAQALYQVFIEVASELENTSQFLAVMMQISDNLGSLGCTKKPCTLHCEPCTLPHAEPCMLPHAESCTRSHAKPCTLTHADPCTLSHADPCTLPHFFITPEPCPFPHEEPCTLLHIDPCTLSHAEPCTLPHNDICALNHFPVEPVTVAVTIPCPLAHSDLCTKEHVPTRSSSPSPAPRQLKRKRFKIKQQKVKAEDFSNNKFFDGLGSEPEIDLDGLFANPNYNLSVALEEFKNCGGSADELHRFRLLHEDLHSVGGACHIPHHLDNSPKSPSVSLPTRKRDHNTQMHPLPTLSTLITPSNLTHPLPPTSTSALPRPVAPSSAPRVSLPRARTEPLPSNPGTTPLPPRAQTALPDISRNMLTACRCTNNDASPSSFVKFMDVPVTMTREHIHDCLKDNRKWSTVDISNMEIFVIKNKDSTVVNVLKIKFKDDAQSTTAKRVLTMNPTSAHPSNIAQTSANIG